MTMYIDNSKLKVHISLWLASMFWLISIMIIVGGLTRLTDSGLSITKWQLFSGIFPPLNENDWKPKFRFLVSGFIGVCPPRPINPRGFVLNKKLSF